MTNTMSGEDISSVRDVDISYSDIVMTWGMFV